MAKQQFDDTNRFTLFYNDPDEKKNPKGPDYSGTVNIDGTVYKLSGWKRKTSAGRVILSGEVSAQDTKPVQPRTTRSEDEPF